MAHEMFGNVNKSIFNNTTIYYTDTFISAEKLFSSKTKEKVNAMFNINKDTAPVINSYSGFVTQHIPSISDVEYRCKILKEIKALVPVDDIDEITIINPVGNVEKIFVFRMTNKGSKLFSKYVEKINAYISMMHTCICMIGGFLEEKWYKSINIDIDSTRIFQIAVESDNIINDDKLTHTEKIIAIHELLDEARDIAKKLQVYESVQFGIESLELTYSFNYNNTIE